MGIDIIDLHIRIEQKFGIEFPEEEFARLFQRNEPPDILAGELHDVICHLLRSAGRPVPYSSWTRLKLTLRDCLGVKPSAIRKESRLMRDLGMD